MIYMGILPTAPHIAHQITNGQNVMLYYSGALPLWQHAMACAMSWTEVHARALLAKALHACCCQSAQWT